MCLTFRLRQESIPEYIRLHQQVWPELLEVYGRAGITQISCFLSDCDVVVYSEYELEVYEAEKESICRDPVEMRWQALMKTLRDPASQTRHFEEVFHMPDLEENL